VRSFPLEKIRLATPDEMLGSQYVIQAMNEVMGEIKDGKLPWRRIAVRQPCDQHLQHQQELSDVGATWIETSCWTIKRQPYVHVKCDDWRSRMTCQIL